MSVPESDHPEILLLGGGHANLLATPLLRKALPDARILLIDAAPDAVYSGMIPGLVAGHYGPDEPRVALTDFAARNGIRFLQGRVAGVDPTTRQIALADGAQIAYGLAALDLGSHTAMPGLAGFARHAVPIKPLAGFTARLSLMPTGSNAAIIGGGIAGAEMALALACRLTGGVTLIEAGPDIAASLGRRTRSRLRSALDRARVQVLTGATVASVEADAVVLADGRRIAGQVTIGIAGARPQDWLARDLPADGAGFVRVLPTLQVEGHPTLFAAGDCAAMIHAPRPKAGVFAVRQAPVLARNLVAAYHGRPLLHYDPQRDYLKIISLGGRTALAEWYGLTLHGRWLWRWKDRIDRRFMDRLQG